MTIFQFDKQLTATIDALQQSSGARSKAEIIRRAIALLKVVVEAQNQGAHLILRKPDGQDQLIVLP